MTITTNNFKSRNMLIRISVCLAVFLCNGIAAFHLSMVASRTPFRQNDLRSRGQSASRTNVLQAPPASRGVTSSLVSSLAVTALKLRLKSQTHVGCDVQASSSDVFLKGVLGPVTVKGRGWGSRLGLSCRAIEATVDKCELDIGRIISNQKLVLTKPAEGRAMVALSATDFGNFITHPLMHPPGLPELPSEIECESSTLEFLKDGVAIDPKKGVISFLGTYLGETWKFELSRGLNGNRAMVKASVQEVPEGSSFDFGSISTSLAETTSKFLNNMIFELDGTFLSFQDMMVTAKGGEASALLSLSITVKKFPSAGLEF